MLRKKKLSLEKMSKRKVSASFTEDDEIFVLKTKMISKSTRKTIEIHDFIKKIEDPEKNKKAIVSPKFKLAGAEFSIHIFPCVAVGVNAPFIGVFLANHSNEEQMASITVKEASAGKLSWEMKKVPGGQGFGFPNFLSHEKYREWANAHGDVLKLEVVVTVHSKAEGSSWTR